ncbi:MAG: GerMN domain-containing protein [Bacillota bacterium]
MLHKKGIIDNLVLAGISLVVISVLIMTVIGFPQQSEEVKLYFSTNQGQNLDYELRAIKSQKLYRNIIQELIAGPTESDLGKTIPQGAKLLSWQLQDQVLVLNFNEKLRSNHWGGSTGEIMTIYSIVNTMTQLSQVKAVRFKIEGQRVESLIGHLDLSDSLQFNEDLVKYKID